MRAIASSLGLLLHLATSCHAHGAMQWPPTWFDANGTCGLGAGCFNEGVMWFTNNTQIPGEPTIPDGSELITYPKIKGSYPGSGGLNVKKNPWRAPGSAAVFSPCGIAGGNPHGCPAGAKQPVGAECPGGGTAYGADAVTLPFSQATTTVWKVGAVVEAGWGIRANHGGGYSYRLCKRGEALTEACFQRTPLAFVGDEQYVQWGTNESRRVAFKANRTDVGTTPHASQWTKNPIPACGGFGGGFMEPAGNKCGWLSGTQFSPPARSLETGKPLEGFCEAKGTGWRSDCPFTIIDKLQVPSDIGTGDYVLSFRWDCEQTSQVWTTCASIHISDH